MTVHHFDVMKAMVDADSAQILLAPLTNVVGLRKVKAGTQVTIGLPGDMVAAIANGRYVGGLVLCEQGAFDETRKWLEEAPAIRDLAEALRDILAKVDADRKDCCDPDAECFLQDYGKDYHPLTRARELIERYERGR